MRKVILSMMVSLDGFIEGQNREIDWHIVDEEFNQYAIDLLNTVDTLLFERVAYQLFERDWPAAATNPSTSKSDLEIANKMNNLPKIVFSKTLQKVDWNNSRLVKENIPCPCLAYRDAKRKCSSFTVSIILSPNLSTMSIDNASRSQTWCQT